MMNERKQRRNAERQRKALAQQKRIRIEKAAPKLLAACKALVNCWNEDEIYPDDMSFKALEAAEAAITEAEREGNAVRSRTKSQVG